MQKPLSLLPDTGTIHGEKLGRAYRNTSPEAAVTPMNGLKTHL